MLPATIHDRHEFLARPLVAEEIAAQHVRLHERRLLFDAAHHHAHVHAAHPDRQSARLEDAPDHVGDIMREVLLRLQPAHVHFDNARDLRSADDGPLRDVADDEVTEERQDVMRAKRLVCSADDHEVLAVLIGSGARFSEQGRQSLDVGEVVTTGHRHQ